MGSSATREESNSPGSPQTPSQVYYLDIGTGDWLGWFRFRITSWRGFRSANLGLEDRLLVIGMHVLASLFGRARITSTLAPSPPDSESVVANAVRIVKFGIRLYTLNEVYQLQADGHQVDVRSKERFGPIPFLFNRSKEHPAEILDDGMHSIYYIPLLGAQWIARYTVRADHQHIDSVMTCSWGEAHENIDRR
jgi:hypothetical protein